MRSPEETASGTLQTIDGRHLLRFERRLAHPPERVWRAVTELDPPRVFAFDWGSENLRFELRPDGQGRVLAFTHRFEDRSGAARFAAGWHLCLDVLQAELDGVQVTWTPDERWSQLHDGIYQKALR